jgi:GDP-mannose 6-dehydrogenase
MMKVVVFGLGRVGTVAAAALLRAGHVVVGIDREQVIRDRIAVGQSPFREPEVADLLESGRGSGRLSVGAAVGGYVDADIVLVCVGTHGTADGGLDLSDVVVAARTLGKAIHRRPAGRPPILLVFQSTMLPGSMTGTVLPAVAAAAGEPPGERYEIAYHPTFIREGSGVADFFAPSRLVIGERTPGCAKLLLDLLDSIDAEVFATSFEAAELVKCSENGLHALKIAFANEIGRFAMRCGIPPGEVFKIITADTKLNLSASYLQPGGAFGGPCLPKDVRALATCMRDAGIVAPVIGHILDSNASHRAFIIAEIARRAPPPSRILLVGLSFKPGTDDLRESPFVALADALLARSYDLTIFDPDLLPDADGGIAHGHALLPARVAAAVTARLDSPASFDLVVLGKRGPAIAALIGADADVFSIDQL